MAAIFAFAEIQSPAPVAVSVSGMLDPRFWEALGARYGTATAVTVKNPVPSGSTMVAVHVIVVSVRPIL
jgi:hypothetical protein